MMNNTEIKIGVVYSIDAKKRKLQNTRNKLSCYNPTHQTAYLHDYENQ